MTPSIKIFNSLTHKEEVLTTLDPNHLKMYVCGPTVYDRPHIGNARSVVVYDLFFRLFKRIFPQVTYVRNITDIDDKINAAAKEQGISIFQLTTKITDFFHQDIAKLNVLSPTHEPKATDHVPEIISMIEKLIHNGHAYESRKHVLFDVASYRDYGKLSNRQLDEMIAGSRIEIADYKKNPLDFVLWKPADDEDDASSVFNSPWGQGRPGWHIECSAMSSKYLGINFDVHGGGADLQFPHHENEIAQSRCAHPNSQFVHYWIHNGFLTVNGEKMSKSLKNFITVRELLDQGIPGIAVRFLLLSTHYRKPCDFNENALELSTKTLKKFYSVISPEDLKNSDSKSLPSEILTSLTNDLNVATTIAALHKLAEKIKIDNLSSDKQALAASLDFLGLVDYDFFSYQEKSSLVTNNQIDEDFINSQIALRIQRKLEKDFAAADKIRNDLLALGVVLEDVTKEKTIWKYKQ